jgi:hypothetical protein
MSDRGVSRREALGALGLGAAAVAGTGLPAVAVAAPVHRSAAQGLLAPLAVGSALGRWIIDEVHPVEAGSMSLVLHDSRGGEPFQLDVCAREATPGAPEGPGVTEHFSVYVSNNGNGNLDTVENQGLAAMAVADVVRGNEAQVDRTPFRTLRQCVAASAVRRHVG